MLDQHLEMLAVEETTLDSYESFMRNHVSAADRQRAVQSDQRRDPGLVLPAARALPHALPREAVRGEVCALRGDRFDAVAAVLVIRTGAAQRGGRTWEKDTKTHQQRRIALDA
jgi:hypothetical protein